MTQKHFKAIAEILSRQIDISLTEEERFTVRTTAESLADYFASENPRFKRTVFLRACGLEN